VPFLARLSAIPGLNFLVLTTNGILLAELAADLRTAGVERLNVSLDSLRPETFRAITRGGDLTAVLRGLDAAVQVGLPHPKLNMVVMKGINDNEIVDFAALARERGCMVRFIEYMPTSRVEGWQDLFLPGEEIYHRIASRYDLVPAGDGQTAGPAKTFRFTDGPGGIGIISAVSGHFCAGCNRIRVTARGIARSCLFADDALDLKPLLREGTRSDVAAALRRFVLAKPGHHLMSPEEANHTPFAMSGIGG
jgi:cyclic pyranopterin phosphate synthase